MYSVRVTWEDGRHAWLNRGRAVPRRAQAKAYSSPSAARRALDGFAKKNPPRACVLEVVRGSDTVAVWLMMEEGQEVPW